MRKYSPVSKSLAIIAFGGTLGVTWWMNTLLTLQSYKMIK